MRSGSLVLSISNRAAVYNFLHPALSTDLALPVFMLGSWIVVTKRSELQMDCLSSEDLKEKKV
jgi:hypothetical protein